MVILSKLVVGGLALLLGQQSFGFGVEVNKQQAAELVEPLFQKNMQEHRLEHRYHLEEGSIRLSYPLNPLFWTLDGLTGVGMDRNRYHLTAVVLDIDTKDRLQFRCGVNVSYSADPLHRYQIGFFTANGCFLSLGSRRIDLMSDSDRNVSLTFALRDGRALIGR